jgi:outer membrane protein insertion porin family
VPSASVVSVAPSASVAAEPAAEVSDAGDGSGRGRRSDPAAAASGALNLRYQLAHIRLRGNDRTAPRVILRYIPFHVGDELEVDDPRLDLVRFRLLGTGYFSDVTLSLSKGEQRGRVVLNVDVVERNTIVVNGLWLGLSGDATPGGASRPLTAYGGADVAETNLLGTGISLGGAVAVADSQTALRLRFVDPSFLGSRWIVGAQALYDSARDFFGTRGVIYAGSSGAPEATDYAVAAYERIGGSLSIGLDLGETTRVRTAFAVEGINATLPAAASALRGLDREPIAFHLIDGRSFLTALSLSLDDDTRDDPALPTRGRHLQLGADVGLPFVGGDYGFLRLVGRYDHWWSLGIGSSNPEMSHVFRLDTFAGAIFGDAPLFYRFYVGDLTDFLPDRVLDLNFDRRPPPNFLGTSVVEMRYEDYAARVVGEYRVPVYRGRRSIYGVDLFAAAGFYLIASGRDLRDPPRGYSGFSRIPVDLTFNLGARISTSAGVFAIGLSNFIGFFPIRHEAGT